MVNIKYINKIHLLNIKKHAINIKNTRLIYESYDYSTQLFSNEILM